MARQLLPSHPPIRCGAKRQDGLACQAPPGPAGNGRCKRHGGAKGIGAPKGSQNASKLGIYASVMSAADVAFAEQTEVGTLAAEIHIIKVQIGRTLAAQKAYDDCVAKGETPTKHLVQMRLNIRRTQRSGGEKGDTDETVEEKTMERPDFEALLDRFTGRLEKLERAHALLTGSIDSDTEDEDGVVGVIRVKVIGGLPDGA